MACSPLHWGHRVLATGPLEKSPKFVPLTTFVSRKIVIDYISHGMCFIPRTFIYFVTGSVYLLISLIYFPHALTGFPFVNHPIVLCIYDCFCFVCSFVLFFIFHLYVKSYSMSLSYFTYIIYSRSIHIVTNARFHSFYGWVIFHYIYTSIYIYMCMFFSC